MRGTVAGGSRIRRTAKALNLSKNLDKAIIAICKKYRLAPNIVVKTLTTGEFPPPNTNLSREALRDLLTELAKARAIIDRDEGGTVMTESDYMNFFTPLPRRRGF